MASRRRVLIFGGIAWLSVSAYACTYSWPLGGPDDAGPDADDAGEASVLDRSPPVDAPKDVTPTPDAAPDSAPDADAAPDAEDAGSCGTLMANLAQRRTEAKACSVQGSSCSFWILNECGCTSYMQVVTGQAAYYQASQAVIEAGCARPECPADGGCPVGAGTCLPVDGSADALACSP